MNSPDACGEQDADLPAPLLVIEATAPRLVPTWIGALGDVVDHYEKSCLALLGLLLGLALVVIDNVSEWFPGTHLQGKALVHALVLLSIPLTVAGCSAWFVYGESRSGKLSFYSSSIKIEKEWQQLALSWTEVCGYSLRAAGYVQLYRTGERRGRVSLRVPTPDEATRVAVIALLDERTITRRA